MKATRLIILGMLTVLMVAGCNDHETITQSSAENYVNGRVIGTIHGIVTDGVNNARLQNVRVTTSLRGATITSTTNSEGYYTFTNLDPGEYVITFRFPGSKDVAEAYAVSHDECDIPTLEDLYMEEEPHTVNFRHTIECNMELYPRTAAISGMVFKAVDGESRVPAANVTVVADFSDWYLSEWEYMATTDSTGAYSFEMLPATDEVYLRTKPFNDGEYDFDTDGNWEDLEPGAEVFADNLVVYVTGINPILVENNFGNDDFGLDENLFLKFSEAMRPETFDIQLDGPNGDVPFMATWSTDNMELTIDPYVTLLPDSWYDIDVEGRSQSQVWFSNDWEFRTIDGIDFVATNLQTIDGQWDNYPVGQPITVTYTLPVNLSMTEVDLETNSGWDVAAATSTQDDGFTLVITPLSALEPGTDYDLSVNAYSDLPGDSYSDSWDFETAETIMAPGAVANFELNSTTFVADFDTRFNFPFRWDTVEGADEYIIWARWNQGKETRALETVDADDAVTFQTETVNLPSDWDYYPSHGGTTPFVNGSDVVFVITAANDAGGGPLSDSITIADTVTPTSNFFGSQSGTANNVGGTEVLEITVQFDASEYLDRAVVPTGVLTNPQGTTATFAWDADAFGGTMTLAIPVGVTVVGETLTLTNFQDTSGNAVDAGDHPSITLF